MKKYPNDYPIENAETLSKEELKKLNFRCKPRNSEIIEIQQFLEINNQKQIKALKDNFDPTPYFEIYDLNYKWLNFVNTITSAMFKNRPGRSLKLLIKDKNYNFIYGVISLSSPMLNKMINQYLKNKKQISKVDFNFLNKYMIDMNVCIGTGILTKYLSAKMLVYLTLTKEIKILWDNKYNTNIKYIMTTSLYGKSSLYNRIKQLRLLGLSEGWNVLFTQQQLDWVKNKHKEFYPHHLKNKTAKAPHVFRHWNQVWRKLHDDMPFFPYKTQRGTYLFDVMVNDFTSLEENINYWKKRWYYPRKERIEKNE